MKKVVLEIKLYVYYNPICDKDIFVVVHASTDKSFLNTYYHHTYLYCYIILYNMSRAVRV